MNVDYVLMGAGLGVAVLFTLGLLPVVVPTAVGFGTLGFYLGRKMARK